MKLNTEKIVGFSLAAFVAVKALVTKISSEITFGTPSLSFGNLTFSSTTFPIDLPLANNTDLSVTIDDFQGTLYYNGQPLAAIQLDAPEPVAPKDTTILDLTATVTHAAIISQLTNILISQQLSKSVIVKGTVFALGKTWQVNQKVDVI